MNRPDNYRDLSCEERLPFEYADTEKFFTTLTDNPPADWLEEYGFDPEDPDEATHTYITEQLLEFSITENTRGINVSWPLVPVSVLFSTGGPADGLILGINPTHYNRIESAYYWYQDWFDGASQEIPHDSRFFEAVATVFDPWTELLDFNQWIQDNRD